MMTETDVWTEMLDNKDLINSQYDVLAGRMPEKYNEVVLIADKNREQEIKHLINEIENKKDYVKFL